MIVVKGILVEYQIIELASVLLVLPKLFAGCIKKVFLHVRRHTLIVVSTVL